MASIAGDDLRRRDAERRQRRAGGTIGMDLCAFAIAASGWMMALSALDYGNWRRAVGGLTTDDCRSCSATKESGGTTSSCTCPYARS